MEIGQEHILQFFAYAHLPAHLQAISKPFCELAHAMVEGDNVQGANSRPAYSVDGGKDVDEDAPSVHGRAHHGRVGQRHDHVRPAAPAQPAVRAFLAKPGPA